MAGGRGGKPPEKDAGDAARSGRQQLRLRSAAGRPDGDHVGLGPLWPWAELLRGLGG